MAASHNPHRQMKGVQMLMHPIIRRRHRLPEPRPLPRPVADVEVAKFLKVIDGRRDW
jgi:hypothetical protein